MDEMMVGIVGAAILLVSILLFLFVVAVIPAPDASYFRKARRRLLRERSDRHIIKCLQQFASGNPRKRQKAFSLLGDLDRDRIPWEWLVAESRVRPEAYVPLLKAESGNVRRFAGRILKQLNWSPDSPEHAVLICLVQNDYERIDKMGESGRAGLIKISQGHNLSLLLAVCNAMGKFPDRSFVKPLERVLLLRENGNTAAYSEEQNIHERLSSSAAKALGEILDVGSVPQLRAALDDGVDNASLALAKMLGPEALEGILRYLFKHPKQKPEYYRESEDSSAMALKLAAKQSMLTDAELAVIIDCCRIPVEARSGFSYSDSAHDGQYKHVLLTQSLQAVERLCQGRSDLSSNLLHLVLTKSVLSLRSNVYDNVKVEIGDRTTSRQTVIGIDSYEAVVTIDFQVEQVLAQAELEARGNPEYDQRHYFRGGQERSCGSIT